MVIFISVVLLGGAIITLALPSSLDDVKSPNAHYSLTAENWDYLVDQVKSGTVNFANLSGKISTNITNIANLSGRITTNTSNIASLSGRLTTLNNTVGTLINNTTSSNPTISNFVVMQIKQGISTRTVSNYDVCFVSGIMQGGGDYGAPHNAHSTVQSFSTARRSSSRSMTLDRENTTSAILEKRDFDD
jgi:hypothetical protein